MYMYFDKLQKGYHICAYKGTCPKSGRPLKSFANVACFIQNRYSVFTEFKIKGFFLS